MKGVVGVFLRFANVRDKRDEGGEGFKSFSYSL